MADLAVTNSFSAGTTIQASQMNTNFTDITGWANGTPNLGVSGSATTVDGTLTVDEAATLTGGVTIGTATPIVLEGASADAYETTIAVTDPTADRTVTLPDSSGTVAYTSNTVPSAGGTFSGNVSITGNLTVTGTTTNHLNIPAANGDAAIAPALGDENKYVMTTHATALVTLPQDSLVGFEIGSVIYYERTGTGTLTFAAGTGASVTSKDSTLTCADRWTTVAAIKTSTNGWALIGNIG